METGDLEAIVRLNASVQQLHYDSRPDWFVAPDLVEIGAWLRTVTNRDDVFIFVADDSGCVVGYALATLHRRPATPFTRPLTILELDQIGVEAGARRRGVGSLLIERIAVQASELGASLTMLTVWDFNDAARAAFKARGFVDAMHRMERSSRA